MTECLLQGLVRETVPAEISTRRILLVEEDWTDLGPGPVQVMSLHPAIYWISDEKPSEAPGEGFRLESRITYKIDFGAHIWAAATATGGATVYVAGTGK